MITMVVRWNLAHMVIGYRPVNFTIGDLFVFLFKLFACCVDAPLLFQSVSGNADQRAQPICKYRPSYSLNARPKRNERFPDTSSKCRRQQSAARGSMWSGSLSISPSWSTWRLIDLAMFAVDAFGWIAYAISRYLARWRFHSI